MSTVHLVCCHALLMHRSTQSEQSPTYMTQPQTRNVAVTDPGQSLTVLGLLQVRAGQVATDKQKQQVHEAALREARHEAAQARQAERTAAAKTTALQQVGCHHMRYL